MDFLNNAFASCDPKVIMRLCCSPLTKQPPVIACADRAFQPYSLPFKLNNTKPSLRSPSLLASASASATGPHSSTTAPIEYPKVQELEEQVEKLIYRCRFLTLLGVSGSLIGSLLCFIKGSAYVVQSFVEYIVNHGTVILLLVEAVDVYLLGTVMLVFGMGLYELFVSNLGTAKSLSDTSRSNLFGMFTLKGRPKWLNIKTVNELKTKLGHVIVMLLLIGLFEKTKKAAINTPLDLLCFAASVLLSSSCLFLLSKLID